MNKKVMIRYLFVFTVILFIFTCTKVNAECSNIEKNNLLQLSHNVKFTYEINEDEKVKNKKKFNVIISNLLDGIYLFYEPYVYEYIKDSITPGVEKMDDTFNDNNTYEVKVYGNTKNCKDVYLETKTIDIPKYNIYSEKEECKGIEDFKLCNMWYEGEIQSESYFRKEVTKYKSSLEKNEEATKTTAKDNLLSKIKKIYEKNIFISLFITLFLVASIVVFIIISVIKRKKRVKIKF